MHCNRGATIMPSEPACLPFLLQGLAACPVEEADDPGSTDAGLRSRLEDCDDSSIASGLGVALLSEAGSSLMDEGASSSSLGSDLTSVLISDLMLSISILTADDVGVTGVMVAALVVVELVAREVVGVALELMLLPPEDVPRRLDRLLSAMLFSTFNFTSVLMAAPFPESDCKKTKQTQHTLKM